MAEYTQNYSLKKPLPNEFYDVADQNSNMDKIDSALKKHDDLLDKKADLDKTGKIPQDQLPELDFIPNDEKGQPNGVAPLNKDKVLEIEYGGTGANNVQEAIYNLGCMPRENLLDNAYFIGGGSQSGDGNFPINQKGQTTYNSGYIIDRWQNTGDDQINILQNGLELVRNSAEYGYIRQFLSKQIEHNKKITFSVLTASNEFKTKTLTTATDDGIFLDDGTYVYYYDGNNTLNIRFTNTRPVISAIKVEYGENQTLARQLEDGSWELLEKPDYATELAKCLRYYGEFRKMEGSIEGLTNNNLWSGHCQAISTDELLVNYQFPVPMRTIPAISVYAKGDGEEMVTINKVRDSSTGASVDISGFTCSYVTNFGFAIIRKQGAFVQSRFYDFIIVANAEL